MSIASCPAAAKVRVGCRGNASSTRNRGLRVFIFTRNTTTSDSWEKMLLDRMHALADTTDDYAWLLWGWTPGGFACHMKTGARA